MAVLTSNVHLFLSTETKLLLLDFSTSCYGFPINAAIFREVEIYWYNTDIYYYSTLHYI